MKHKRDAYIKRLNGIYERNLEKDNVEYISGMASFVSNDSVTLGNGEKIHAKKILIAVGMSFCKFWLCSDQIGEKRTALTLIYSKTNTGGRPTIPKVPGADLGIDSDGFFDLEHQPKRVAVVGTGYIGVELAGIFHALGKGSLLFTDTSVPYI